MNKTKIEQAAFEIISFAGAAKALFSEAIDLISQNNLKTAKDKIKEGKLELAKVHKAHFELISFESQGNQLEFSLLLVHAEDQFMSAENAMFLAEKLLILPHKNS
ncbi:Lactose-specific phosphotransferase enzyme IIA component [Mycoplasmopsis californica]|uniref:PTS lactose/cellobiose transporter subunit IIA n=1 Tax=Mycoplasmopsis equigenitalium TaxID=114883 RepID=A0ABY5J3E2_9BACT|nr:PTS lactose/cellobiose transporter subunit IIA [Mycoplasmopsis equigenitalium]UUD36667.1 PTS lactose/cellobiose transporter subunit IIA [Mycoplasmopsis equigenitalium]VEU69371.1 Lactose-specific phosphotransferase enzyme IIA component [Mycoplasmopsis californica]